MSTHNGPKNWQQWNVALWINNDETLYSATRHFLKRARLTNHTREDASSWMLDYLHDSGITHTPDGAKYTKTSIRAAMVGII